MGGLPKRFRKRFMLEGTTGISRYWWFVKWKLATGLHSSYYLFKCRDTNKQDSMEV